MYIMNGRLFNGKGIEACSCMQGASLVDCLLCGNDMTSYFEYFNIEQGSAMA